MIKYWNKKPLMTLLGGTAISIGAGVIGYVVMFLPLYMGGGAPTEGAAEMSLSLQMFSFIVPCVVANIWSARNYLTAVKDETEEDVNIILKYLTIGVCGLVGVMLILLTIEALYIYP